MISLGRLPDVKAEGYSPPQGRWRYVNPGLSIHMYYRHVISRLPGLPEEKGFHVVSRAIRDVSWRESQYHLQARRSAFQEEDDTCVGDRG